MAIPFDYETLRLIWWLLSLLLGPLATLLLVLLPKVDGAK